MRYTNHVDLRDGFYGIELYCGKVNTKAGRRVVCYFVVEYPENPQYMHKQALQLLMSQCDSVDIYGTCSKEWQAAFEKAYCYAFSAEFL